MSKYISFKDKIGAEETSDQRLALILPVFVVCIRDFCLELTKDDGSDRSAHEYLEDCLKSKPDDEKYNKPRECIKKCFPRRACFTFDRPGDRSTLLKLEELKLSDLSADFRRDTELFLECMYRCPPKQLLCSKPVTGEMFAVLIKSYVDAIRNGDGPDVDDAYEAVANLENEKLEREAVESFQKSIEEIELPVNNMDELDNIRLELVNESLQQFRQKTLSDPTKFEDRALDKMDNLWKEVKERNQDLVTKFCQKQLDDVYNEVLARKIQKKRYHKPGGYEKYLKDREKAEQLFYSKVSGIDENIVKYVVCCLLERQIDIENEIMACDKQLSEEEIAKENQRRQTEIENAKDEQRKLQKSMEKEEERRKQKHKKQIEEMWTEYEKREKESRKTSEDLIKNIHEQKEKDLAEQRERDEGFIKIRIKNPFSFF